ncbi:MAG: HAMP domain-containing sensor histidine kinase [Myxococcota bacterium]
MDDELDGEGGEEAGARVQLRNSLAARITVLVLIMLLAAAASAVVMIAQLRSLQASFDRLTEVYVVFNQRLATAHVQAVRVHEQVRTHQSESVDTLDDAFLSNFSIALRARSTSVVAAREPVDNTLASPAGFGDPQLEALQEIRASLDELQELAELDEIASPTEVLVDIQTQNRITQLFKTLAVQSESAVEELEAEVADAREQTEQRTVLLIAAVAVLGALATGGLFLTLRPLRQLTQKVRDLGRGDWSQRLELDGGQRRDEVSQLASEFNQMAAALEERERRLLRGERLAAAGQLAAQITHEIRNPLSSVGLNVELLEDEMDEMSPEARNLLGEITKEVDRLTIITEDYLRFARRPKPELGRLDLREHLSSLVTFLTPEIELAGVELVTVFPEADVWVEGDANQLRQVFMNLVRNAVEAVTEPDRDDPPPPRVEVQMSCKDGRALVVVRDNGPGIDLPADALERIFEAFFTRKAQGTGLGLPIVQEIVADHGGGVRVAETGPSGTTFAVEIPAARS